jgi:glycerol-3-phosphate cytidylyltransferase
MEHKYINNCTLSEPDLLDNIVQYIKDHHIKMISIMNESLLIYCFKIKELFKKIVIHFYAIKEIDTINLVYLNYINIVYCSNKEYMDHLNHLFFQTKPHIDYIRVITFGTFDLFHKGHYNILKRASDYGILYVGVSTDALNVKKNKRSVNDLHQRKIDVYTTNFANLIFDEESLELKNDYVKKYACNLLIMGDDWKDGFNFCDCACLYLPRTPDISTTLLKQNLGLL